ncbi:MAG: hypothetical protein HY928_01770 [Elusimicrobia bacterium]|nr:hypothetical protein [Elusimicrobiota bacterium]
MQHSDKHAGPRRVAFAALLFFAAVILFFLWPKLSFMGGRKAQPWSVPAVEAVTPGGDTGLPTAKVRMKVKRIEPRKYRREGSELPPPVVRR